MKRQWLFILLLLASAMLLRLQINTEQGREEGQETAGQLTTIDPETIRNIRIQRQSDTLLFSMQDNTWVMTQPNSGPANPERITELRALAILDVLSSYDAASLDLGSVGLAPPQLSVWLNDTRIDFGKLNPANQRRYVLVNKQLSLIAETIYPILSLPPEAFLQPGPAKPDNTIQ